MTTDLTEQQLAQSLSNVEATAPQTIYLVIGEDCPPEADFTDCDEVNWCADKIDANSIKYVRASSMGAGVAAPEGWRLWMDRGWAYFKRPDGFTQAVTGEEPSLSHAQSLHMLISALAAAPAAPTGAPSDRGVTAADDALQAPAVVAQPQEVQDAAWRKWADAGTVASLIAFLATLDQAEPIVTAYHVTMGSGERRCKTHSLTISRERVDHATKTIRTADKSLPYTHVLWAHPPEPAGLSLAQEPKYTVNGHAIVNRASGEEIPADEPVFIFRARDVHAMYALRDYLHRLPLGEHHKAVERRCMNFFDFKAANPGRMKEPDTEPAPAPTSEPQPEAGALISKDVLTDLIAGRLSGTYHCTRVWSAWGYGTMSQDDFSDVSESDTPAEIADAILEALSSRPQARAEAVAADARRFCWVINPDNWDETNDTPCVATSEDVHWGDKARALIDRHMQKD